jgi:hypothetical protein
MKAYTRISLPANKLNMSSPEGDENYEIDTFFQAINYI